MKSVLHWLLPVLLFAMPLQAAGPNEAYVGIYTQMKQAEALERTDRPAQALAMLIEAQGRLLRFQTAYPTWNPKVVQYRLDYLTSRIEELKAKTAPPSVATPGEKPSAEAAPEDPAAAALQQQMTALQQRVDQLQSDNTILQAKLKEALSVRPAAADPQELAKAEARNRSLAKEIALLKTRLAETGVSATTAMDAQATETAESALADATKKADQLASEKAALLAKLNDLEPEANAAEALRAENAVLKQELAELRSFAPSGPGAGATPVAAAQIAVLQNELDILALEKYALEARLQKASAPATVATARDAGQEQRIQELERERDELKARVTELTGLTASFATDTPASEDVENLKARLAVYEAERAPYSVEELALLRMSHVSSLTNDDRGTLLQQPADAGKLIAEANRYLREQQYDKAEGVLLKMLKNDQTNAFTLLNLAATQMELGKLDEAEQNLRVAREAAPDDASVLGLMGWLKFRQQEHDQALDMLSRAAEMERENASIQNYLGVVLSEKGLRGPAETALRRAVQLKPGYAEAHYHLAVVYAFQDPPLVELARWHYQKARASGYPRNLEIERQLDQKTRK